jgi:hypothetical protein
MSYVIINNMIRPCRAADPEHCRFHVGATHFNSRREAVTQLEADARNSSRMSLKKNEAPSGVLTSDKIRSAMKDGRKLMDLYMGRL